MRSVCEFGEPNLSMQMEMCHQCQGMNITNLRRNQLRYVHIYQEREILVRQIEQAVELQGEAEKEADVAMDQLEEFLNEQEELVSAILTSTQTATYGKNVYAAFTQHTLREAWLCLCFFFFFGSSSLSNTSAFTSNIPTPTSGVSHLPPAFSCLPLASLPPTNGSAF